MKFRLLSFRYGPSFLKVAVMSYVFLLLRKTIQKVKDFKVSQYDIKAARNQITIQQKS